MWFIVVWARRSHPRVQKKATTCILRDMCSNGGHPITPGRGLPPLESVEARALWRRTLALYLQPHSETSCSAMILVAVRPLPAMIGRISFRRSGDARFCYLMVLFQAAGASKCRPPMSVVGAWA